jgi:hypothetical protein
MNDRMRLWFETVSNGGVTTQGSSAADCGEPHAIMANRGHFAARSRRQSIEELDDYVPDRFDRRWINRAFVASLTGRVAAPGAYANWISPPTHAINKQPVNFEVVRFNR